jgi:hypothetical protein
MNRIKEKITRWFTFKIFMICSFVLMLAFTAALANDRNEAKNSNNSSTISESDFKRMILESKFDTSGFNLDFKKHLESIPAINNSYEFRIMTIPLINGFEGVKVGNGQRVFKKQRKINLNNKR